MNRPGWSICANYFACHASVIWVGENLGVDRQLILTLMLQLLGMTPNAMFERLEYRIQFSILSRSNPCKVVSLRFYSQGHMA